MNQGMVYFIASSSKIKIGLCNNLKRRLSQLSTSSSEPLIVLATIETDNTRKLEHDMHLRFKKDNCNLEWFNPSEELISYINNISKDNYVEVENGKIKVYKKMSVV